MTFIGALTPDFHPLPVGVSPADHAQLEPKLFVEDQSLRILAILSPDVLIARILVLVLVHRVKGVLQQRAILVSRRRILKGASSSCTEESASICPAAKRD